MKTDLTVVIPYPGQQSGIVTEKMPHPKGQHALHRFLSYWDVIVGIGAGSIGQAIARLVSAGKHVLLADLRQQNAEAAAEVLSNAGFG
jgi:hypothetical protein